MNTKTLVATVVLAATTATTASAESYDATQPTPPNGQYVHGAMSLGGQRDLQAALALEAGRSIVHPRVFMRAQMTIGSNTERGRFQQARVGLERRGCVVREFFCAFAGVDVGYQHDVVDMTPWTFSFPIFTGSDVDRPQPVHIDAHDALVVPRAGVELGQHIKTRLTLEMPLRSRLDAIDDDDPKRTGTGLAVSLGWGYAF